MAAGESHERDEEETQGGPMPDDDDEGGSALPESVRSALMMDRSRALMSGYLRKRNRRNKWNQRYFEILGSRYLVYFKTHDSSKILASMDLHRAGPVDLVDSEGSFALQYDKRRVFRAANQDEAAKWVEVIRAVQSAAPKGKEDGVLEMERAPPEPPKRDSSCCASFF